MNYMPMPDLSMLTRRRALLLAGTGLGAVAFTACGGAGNAEGQAGSSSEAGSSATQASSASSPGVSGDASATPTPVGETFSKGFSGGSQAPEGEYRPADDKGPAQNVPKPQEPEGMNLETPESLAKYLEYVTELRNYTIQTGDGYVYAKSISAAYTDEIKLAAYMSSLYKNGGWVMGGIRKINVEIGTMEKVSGKEYQYTVLGRNVTGTRVVADNKTRKLYTDDFSEDNKYTNEYQVVYNGKEWLLSGVVKVVKIDN